MINIKKIKHILISRIDNIGDVTLTLPMAAFLKAANPELKISFLVQDYTAELVRLNASVDEIISWDTLLSGSEKAAIQFLRSKNIDCVIHVYPKSRIARLMKRANISYRIGTFRRVYHWWTCNRLVYFSRAKSELHEAVLNLKLLKPLGIDVPCEPIALVDKVTVVNKAPLPTHLAQYLSGDKFNLILHPFTNGHTREWPVSQFNALIRQLPKDKFQIIITGSSKELEKIKKRIISQCPDVINLAGKCSLTELMQFIAQADGLVANGTGPMHLAAAFGIHTLGLFPSEKNVDPKRWAPIGVKAEWLMVDPNCQAPRCKASPDCLCMESITVDQVQSVLMRWANGKANTSNH